MRHSVAAFVSCAFVLLFELSLSAAFPKHTGYVNDFTNNTLSAEERAQLEELLRGVEGLTSAEIAVAIVPSLEDMSVEEYANRMFKEWGIGKKSLDNGVLVLVAPIERKMRIEVGYGLEPILPDGLAGEIIRTNFLPHFRDNEYAIGIQGGVARIVDVVRRKHVVTADERAAFAKAADNSPPMLVIIPFLGAFVGIGFFMMGTGVGSKTVFPILFGLAFGGAGLLFSALFRPAVYVLGPFAAIVAIAGFRNGRSGKSSWANMSSGSPSSGWTMGTDSSSSGSSSDSSSSSSDFGGGDSGGGGASGSW